MIRASSRYGTVFITRKVFFYGLLSMIPYYIWRPGLGIELLATQPQLIWNLLFLGCIASMVCFLAWNWVLKKLGAVVATNYVYLNPVCTIIVARLVLSERITSWFLVGTVLIITGMYMSARRRIHQRG